MWADFWFWFFLDGGFVAVGYSNTTNQTLEVLRIILVTGIDEKPAKNVSIATVTNKSTRVFLWYRTTFDIQFNINYNITSETGGKIYECRCRALFSSRNAPEKNTTIKYLKTTKLWILYVTAFDSNVDITVFETQYTPHFSTVYY